MIKDNIMTFEDFYAEVLQAMNQRPDHYRKGQAVFNYIDENYGVARYVQFVEGIDCFFDDNQINPFIYYSYMALNQ